MQIADEISKRGYTYPALAWTYAFTGDAMYAKDKAGLAFLEHLKATPDLTPYEAENYFRKLYSKSKGSFSAGDETLAGGILGGNKPFAQTAYQTRRQASRRPRRCNR